MQQSDDGNEREWAKYKRLRESEKSRKKAVIPKSVGATAGSESARKSKKRKKSGASTQDVELDAEGLLFLKDGGLSKTNEPCDSLRIAPNDDGGGNARPGSLSQCAQALSVLGERERQTMKTLALSESHVHFDDLTMELKRINHQRNPQARVFPLRRLIEHGFMPVDAPNPEETLACLGREMQLESDYMTHSRECDKKQQQQQQQLEAGTQQEKRDFSVAKLNMVFGSKFHSLNYGRRIPKENEEQMEASASSRQVTLFKKFYANDRVDAKCVDFGVIPADSHMFVQLNQEFGEKYKQHEAITHDAAGKTPKCDIECLPRRYFHQYRMKPLDGDPLCANGEACIFNTFSPLAHVSYVGKAFFTRHERKRGLHKATAGAGGGDDRRLCIDCLLAHWTLQHDRNVANEVEVTRAMNHFQVYCRRGQYSEHCMLSTRENDKQTGIEGHVPRFSLNNREFVVVQESIDAIDQDNKLHTVYSPFLAEIGMDF